jgi:transcriptional regulator with XRE-family HTH domain
LQELLPLPFWCDILTVSLRQTAENENVRVDYGQITVIFRLDCGGRAVQIWLNTGSINQVLIMAETRKRSLEPTINVSELGQHLKRRREVDHLSLRDVTRLTEVSAATLSRIENGAGVPDTQTLTKIARWLNVPLERVINSHSQAGEPVVYYPNEPIPDILEAHLRADPTLTAESARALAELFRVAYTALGSKQD